MYSRWMRTDAKTTKKSRGCGTEVRRGTEGDSERERDSEREKDGTCRGEWPIVFPWDSASCACLSQSPT